MALLIGGSCHWTHLPGGFSCAFLRLVRRSICTSARVTGDKRFVYVLKSVGFERSQFYVGVTSNVAARLVDHNAGRCSHTATCRPWQIHVIVSFSDQQRAIAFERYLKSGSGRAFAKRHFE
jgi:putative endonuclease